MLEAISVSKSFEGKPVLQNVNLAASGTVAIMAPSGSGKTTLLRILLGLLAPDAGEVRTGGARVGAVFQEDRLIEHMTALQNLALVAGKASRAQLREHLIRLGLNAEADKILATIINDSMSQYEKAKAIFNWCHNQIGYYDGTPKTNWVQGAYRGLVNRRGDCYVYAMTAKCLLTRAGIKNMDIEKIPSKTRHYWNLIDLGEGWYHFDTCRRSDGSTFFYVTDAKLMAYSNAHHGSHNYDPSKYPHIQ